MRCTPDRRWGCRPRTQTSHPGTPQSMPSKLCLQMWCTHQSRKFLHRTVSSLTIAQCTFQVKEMEDGGSPRHAQTPDFHLFLMVFLCIFAILHEIFAPFLLVTRVRQVRGPCSKASFYSWKGCRRLAKSGAHALESGLPTEYCFRPSVCSHQVVF